MGTKRKLSTWLYVIVITSTENEQILGQSDHERDISFIPAFKTKAAAEKGLPFLSKEVDDNYEVQAIICEDLLVYASNKKFLIIIIDEKGTIEDCITP